MLKLNNLMNGSFNVISTKYILKNVLILFFFGMITIKK